MTSAHLARSLFSVCSRTIKLSNPQSCYRRGRHAISSFRGFPVATCTTTADQTPKKTRKKTKSKNQTSDAISNDDSSAVLKKKRKSKSQTSATDASDEPPVSLEKKRKKRKVISDEEVKDSLIGGFVPFEGTHEGALDNADVSFQRLELPDGRFYHYQSSTDSYSFPSVTTVLDKTSTKSYPLLLWKRKLTELHGKEGFDTIRNNTLKSGINFHKVSSQYQRVASTLGYYNTR